jgi:prepilin-type N-terminal cleavage/methylation domain-containing protein
MNADRKKIRRPSCRARGFSLIELVIVLSIAMVVAAMVVPNVLRAVSNFRLRASAADLASLMQQARILAAKNNATYEVRYTTLNSAQIAYVDLNGNGSFDTGEPLIQFSNNTLPASGAPTGTGGQPTPYVLAGDTGTGSFNNTNTLGYTGRGLPCNYDTTTSPATCSTPAATYFVYYITDSRQGWAATVVTKSGRVKTTTWNGTSWN